MDKDVKIIFRTTEEHKKYLQNIANIKFKGNLTKYLLHALRIKNKNILRCPKCKNPIADKENIPVIGESLVKCYHCKYEFDYFFV